MLETHFQNNLKNKLTLIIPTRNKSHFLLALLEYYNSIAFPFKILIIDDSDNPNIKKLINRRIENFTNLNIDYRETQFQNLFEALLFALQNAETPYVLNSGDDDYFSISMISKMINFLDSNLDYISTSGLSVKMNAKWDEENKSWQKVSVFNATTNSYDSENVQDRISLHIKKYKVITYSVVRTKELRHVYEVGYSNNFYLFPALIELFQNAVLLIAGKHKRFFGFFHFWFAPIDRRRMSHEVDIADISTESWFDKFNLKGSTQANLACVKILKEHLNKQDCDDSGTVSEAIWMSYYLNFLLRRHKEYLLTCSNFRNKTIFSRILYKVFVIIAFRLMRSNPQEALEKFWSNLYFYFVAKLFLLSGTLKLNPSAVILTILNKNTVDKTS